MKIAFSNPHIAIAGIADIADLTSLLNNAYRGEESKKGWTTEENLISGDVRTNAEALLAIMQIENSVLLKYSNDKKEIIGCVNLQQHENKIYLGMLSVSPHLQGIGIGKYLLKAAEEYAHQLQCSVIYMTVISLRIELISWYNRHGYRDTGERKSFEEDISTGRHLQPLEFAVLEKVVV